MYFLWWLLWHIQLWKCKTTARSTLFNSVWSITSSFITGFVVVCAPRFRPCLGIKFSFILLILKHLRTSQYMDAVLDPALLNSPVHGMVISVVPLLPVGSNVSNKCLWEFGFQCLLLISVVFSVSLLILWHLFSYLLSQHWFSGWGFAWKFCFWFTYGIKVIEQRLLLETYQKWPVFAFCSCLSTEPLKQ